MPIKKCAVNGKSGWKYGDSGKCYAGPNGKKLAIKQAVAINKGKFPKHEGKASLEPEDDILISEEEQIYSNLSNTDKVLLQLEANLLCDSCEG